MKFKNYLSEAKGKYEIREAVAKRVKAELKKMAT